MLARQLFILVNPKNLQRKGIDNTDGDWNFLLRGIFTGGLPGEIKSDQIVSDNKHYVN